MNKWQRYGLLACVSVTTACAQLGADKRAAVSPATQEQKAQETIQVTRKMIAPRLYELAYSARQQAVFVASAGGADPVSEPSRILRLNPADLSVTVEIPLERGGFGVALDDAANRLYVGNALTASVTVVDTTQNRVLGVVQLAEPIRYDGDKAIYPHLLRELVVDQKRQRLYAPGLSAQGSVLYVVDTANLKLDRVVSGLGAGAAGIALDKEGNRLYVSNLQGQVFGIDTKTLTIKTQWEVKADQLLNLAYDHKRHRLLASDLGSERMDTLRKEKAGLTEYEKRGTGHRMVAIDARNGALLASVPTGKAPIAPMLDEGRDRVYISNRDSGTVSVLDAEDYTLLATVPLAPHPNSLTLDAASGNVYVSIKEESRTAREGVARLAPR
ncbi:YncE family protein [Alcaligenes phenolicus]|uniref:YncE family protein n=1 Tax=Alcaligenes TaxID=507 RepID=UPI0009F44BC5|nr:YncE family protein [Alcaligenes phenolicus]